MTVPHRGTIERASAELFILAIVRPVRPSVRWLARQQWVAAYAEWDEKHVPSRFTFWNVMYLGCACYAALVVFALVTGRV